MTFTTSGAGADHPPHYDPDYDLIAEKTDLRFDSVWLAARGAL
jgi:hypothetical protein